ncbi:MAG: DNA methylase, partial [Oscillospiraceae bacterium]|nr:DNA methylase [Oscillospiraceae bacterium]
MKRDGRGSDIFIAIDLKSFYASVECVNRGLDPLRTNLVVADESRTEKTICLAVSPPLKAYGVSGRARLFEVVQRVKELNRERLRRAPGGVFTGKSADADALEADPSLELDYIVAVPRMAHYMKCSTEIYQIYLKYAAPEHIHVYSIDEVFIDAAVYIKTRRTTPRKFAQTIIQDILRSTGITATAGIGPNLYLAKVAMDIEAKHAPADANGVRIAELDERIYREKLWGHRPLTDFWRVGRGYAKKLEAAGLFTMGDIARCSLGKASEFYNEDLLYHMFGVNAELLIDHAWGWEPVTLSEIKAYRPESNSVGAGQVLTEPYSFDKAKIIVREMADALALGLVEKGFLTDQIVLTVCYDAVNLADPEFAKGYAGPVTTDHYGKRVPKHAHGTANLGGFTMSSRRIVNGALEVYDRTVNPKLLVRRVFITANHIIAEQNRPAEADFTQLSLFDAEQPARDTAAKLDKASLRREREMQRAMLAIRRKYGANAILKGTS